jgi:hypothetical protein
MFALARRGTVIAEGLKIVGSVTAEGLVEVNGQIEGELHCTSLIITRQAHVTGTIAAERVVVDGRVDGPIQGGEVVLKSQAHAQLPLLRFSHSRMESSFSSEFAVGHARRLGHCCNLTVVGSKRRWRSSWS